jgi:cytochrome c biogenesis protein
MRTALILLFLLALAAIPGSLLPQRSLSQTQVAQYYRDHPSWAPVLDRLYLFDVFASPWFAAVYLLLFVSLIGCVLPRTRDLIRSLRAAPPPAPRHLHRLPHAAALTIPGPAEPAASAAVDVLRKRHYRVVVRDGRDGVEISAERGYLKEIGNVVFHLAMLALLIGLAGGKLWGYEGSILVTEGGSFCNSPQQYDNYRTGPLVDTATMVPLCVDLQDFQVVYEPNGTPARFRAHVSWGEPGSVDTATTIGVNNPLRVDGARVYVTGHGYAPTFTVTLPDGTSFDDISAPFLPSSTATMASQGALKLPDLGAGTSNQLAVEGFFAPTGTLTGGVLTSIDPRPLRPEVALIVYRGYLGLDSGAPQSVYSLDQARIDRGQLVQVGSGNLAVGQTLTIDDGTTITFTGFQRFAAMQVSHDPGQGFVLGAAIAILAGLLLMLLIPRTRVFLRVQTNSTGDCELAIGFLSRGSGDVTATFDDLVDRLRTVLDQTQPQSRVPAAT